MASLIDYPLDFSAGLLLTGEDSLGIGPMPWPMLVALGAVLGWYLKGWRLSLLTGLSIFYFAVFGLWEDSMKTLAVVAVSVPVAGLLGFSLGLLAAKRRWFERILLPFLNVLQAFPHFSYLLPVVVFVGLSNKAGVIATIVFAFPPMARLTLLGLRGISPEIIEAGEMSGATPRQMLWKVELPAARRALMVGVNQVVMGCLGMVVVASFIGTNGLGLELKGRLGSLRIGEGLEIGIAVVLMAVILDRLSQAWAAREPEHRDEVPHLERFRFAYLAMGLTVVTYVLSKVSNAFNVFPKDSSVSFSGTTDAVMDWAQKDLPVQGVKDWLLINLLLPLRDAFEATPWIVGVALIIGIGWALKGPSIGGIRWFARPCHRAVRVLVPRDADHLPCAYCGVSLHGDGYQSWCLGAPVRSTGGIHPGWSRHVPDDAIVHLSAAGDHVVSSRSCGRSHRDDHLSDGAGDSDTRCSGSVAFLSTRSKQH